MLTLCSALLSKCLHDHVANSSILLIELHRAESTTVKRQLAIHTPNIQMIQSLVS